MFQRLLSVFLCTCMVVGSVPNTAYAAATNVGRQTETVAEVAVENEEESGATITTVEAGNVPEETGTTGETVAETERETEETETSVETEEETGETETSGETEEETGETETSVETEEETETTVETEEEPEETEESTEMEVESQVIETVEETTEPDMLVLEEKTDSEEEAYGELLASGNCGASYKENNETKTYDVTWAVYDSNTDGNDTADNGDLLVISGSGDIVDYPEYDGYEGYDASTIPWKAYHSSLKVLKIQDGITRLGDYAFSLCTGLDSVELPDSLTSIGERAFENCKSLESIKMPDSVTTIGQGIFSLCVNLKSVELSANLTNIENGTFAACISLESVELPSGVTRIGYNVFSYCYALKGIELPDTVTCIEGYAFAFCNALEYFKVPKSVETIGPDIFYKITSEITVYSESSLAYTALCNTIPESTNIKLLQPYRISYYSGEEEILLAEVCADGMQSYTFKEGDIPSEFVWYDADYNGGKGLLVMTGFTVEKIKDDINLELADMDGFYSSEIPEQIYTGKALKPEPAVYDCNTGKLLKKGTDYTISYKNNVKAYTLTKGEKEFDYKKAPQIVIKGKGNYSNTLTVYFTIQPKDIGDADVLVSDMLVEYTGKVQKKVPTITYNKKKLSGTAKPVAGQSLKNVKDFVYSYPSFDVEEIKDSAYKETGTYQILLEGTGNFTGSRTVTLTIINKGTNLTKTTIKKIPTKTYTGKEITLDETELIVVAKRDGKNVTLKKDTDYSVSYTNNVNVGNATVTITGMGEYTGTKTASFKIKGTSIAKAQVSGLVNKEYNGKEQKQELTLTLNNKTVSGNETITEKITLTEGTDYTVTYNKNVNAGTAKVTITGKGGYTGTIKRTFKIKAYDLTGETNAGGTVKADSLLTEAGGLLGKKDGELTVKYLKGGCKPEVQLFFDGKEMVAGKDYTIAYSNNKAVTTDKLLQKGKAPAITIKGKGNFKGSFKKTFTIISRSLNDSEYQVKMTAVDKAVSTKKGGYISKPVLTDADGKVLKLGKDYSAPVYTMDVKNGTGETQTVILGKNDKVSAGEVITVKVKGMGNYSEEEIFTTYRITAKNFGSVKVQSIQKDYTGKEVTLEASDFYIADGTNRGTSKVTFGSGKNKVELEYGKDFEIVEGSYKNNIKKGTASVTLRGLGDYGGTKTIKFKVGVRGFFWWLIK